MLLHLCIKISTKRVAWLIGKESGVVSLISSTVVAGLSYNKLVKQEKKFKTQMNVATPYFIES